MTSRGLHSQSDMSHFLFVFYMIGQFFTTFYVLPYLQAGNNFGRHLLSEALKGVVDN